MLFSNSEFLWLLHMKCFLMYGIFISASDCHEVFTLPKTYDKYHKPHFHDNPWTMDLNLRGIEVTSIDNNERTLKADLKMMFSWVDPRIDTSHKGNQSFRQTLNPGEVERLWIPSLYINGMKQLETKRGITDTRAVVLSNGPKLTYGVEAILTTRCEFDFQLYPVDAQVCAIDIHIIGLHEQEHSFLTWSKDNEVGRKTEPLPLYYVKICSKPDPVRNIVGEGLSLPGLRIYISLERQIKSHIIQMYLPSAVFVVVSWASFLVPPEMVPGRMALLVTNLLSLVTLLIAIRASSPPALGISCAEGWLVLCIMNLFLALLEYSYILLLARRSTLKSKGKEPVLYIARNALYGNRGMAVKEHEGKTYMRKFMSAMGKHFTQYDKDKWGIQDRTSLILFPLLFALSIGIYVAYVIHEYNINHQKNSREFTKCWEDQRNLKA